MRRPSACSLPASGSSPWKNAGVSSMSQSLVSDDAAFDTRRVWVYSSFRRILPTSLSRRSQSADREHADGRGAMLAAGVREGPTVGAAIREGGKTGSERGEPHRPRGAGPRRHCSSEAELSRGGGASLVERYTMRDSASCRDHVRMDRSRRGEPVFPWRPTGGPERMPADSVALHRPEPSAMKLKTKWAAIGATAF